MTAYLEYRDKIAVLTLGDDENRFSPDWMDTVDALLDDVESNALGLVTVGLGKFYSNGLDLEWLGANPEGGEQYIGKVQSLFDRVLTFSLPTIAAVNGHAFGAGAMLAIAHDYRIMRDDRGYYCFPEVDINIPFTRGMAALIQAKLTPQTAISAMTTGRRYGGAEALTAGLVDATASESTIVDDAIARLTPITGKNPGVLRTIKSTMFSATSDALLG